MSRTDPIAAVRSPRLQRRILAHCGRTQAVRICLMTSEDQCALDNAQIQLSSEESIVLFELLSRWCEDNKASTPEASCFESTAECAVLHRLLADLEKQLVAPFKADYRNFLDEARNQLNGAWDYPTLRG